MLSLDYYPYHRGNNLHESIVKMNVDDVEIEEAENGE